MSCHQEEVGDESAAGRAIGGGCEIHYWGAVHECADVIDGGEDCEAGEEDDEWRLKGFIAFIWRSKSLQ